MKKAVKIIVKIVSVIITLLILIKFISLLDFITFDFGVTGDFCKIGWNIPGWILGFIGFGLDIWLYKKILTSKIANIIFRINAGFCLVVALLDLFIIYVSSQI